MDPSNSAAGEPTGCPAPSQLRALVDEHLPESARRDIGRHLDQCSACRNKLDAMLGEVVPTRLGHSRAQRIDVSEPISGEAKTVPILRGGGDVPEKIGRYTILRVLGEGGFGFVYLAEQHEPVQRKVALKVLKAGMDSHDILARFDAERQALALMDHPHIAHVLDAGQTEQGRPYFAMELVRGVSITDYCDTNKLSLRERIELLIPVCHAIQHAHQKGVIHRDLKPSNVMITLVDEKPAPKIIDFGIAKAVAEPLTERTLYTERGQLIGTPEYMSPEQAGMTGHDIDTRTDIYALGVVLYQLLTGTLPFEQKTFRRAGLVEIQRMICEVEPPKPSTRLLSLGDKIELVTKSRGTDRQTLGRQIRGDLDWITLKCLEKDRTRRYETANALALDLKRHLEDEPVSAGPPSTVYRARKFVRKHRLGVTAACAVFLALILGLVGTTYFAITASTARAQTEEALVDRNEALVAEKEQRRLADIQTEEARWQAYLANITLANSDLEFNRPIAEVRKRLDNCPEHLRGWEWHWLNAQISGAVLSLNKHLGAVLHASFSPDTRRVLTASADNTAIVWDTGSGDVIFTLSEHKSPVTFAGFSPAGTRIITTSEDNRAILWDADTGEKLHELTGHGYAVRSAVFSPDGQRLLTVSNDGTARLWDAQSGNQLGVFDKHTDNVRYAVFSNDGGKILTASRDQSVRVWDSATGVQLFETEGHSNSDSTASLSPGGDRVAAAQHSGKAIVWNIADGTTAFELTGHVGSVTAAVFNHVGDKILTTSVNGSAFVWDSGTGDRLFGLPMQIDMIHFGAFSPDDRYILTVLKDRVTVWDAKSGGLVATLQQHTDQINTAEFGRSGERIVTASADGTACIWGIATGELAPFLHGLTQTNQDTVNKPEYDSPQFSPTYAMPVLFSSDALCVLSGGGFSGGSADWHIYDVQSGIPITQVQGLYGPILTGAWSPSGNLLAAAAFTNEVRIWEAGTGQQQGVLADHTGLVQTLVYSVDGSRIATASHDLTIKVWDTNSNTLIADLPGHFAPVNRVRFDQDAQLLASGSMDMTVRIWDTSSGNPVAELTDHTGPVWDVRFSPDGKYVASASADKTGNIWNIQATRRVALTGHGDQVNSIGFSPDGSRVVTASNDGTARVWDAQSGAQLALLDRHSAWVSCASFSPDGSRVLTASGDRSIRLWDAQTYEEVITLKMEAGQVRYAAFSTDGLRIYAMTPEGVPRVWDSRPSHGPSPTTEYQRAELNTPTTP